MLQYVIVSMWAVLVNIVNISQRDANLLFHNHHPINIVEVSTPLLTTNTAARDAQLSNSSVPWETLPVTGSFPYNVRGDNIILTIGDRYSTPPSKYSILSSADRATFEVSSWGEGFARDKNHVFYYGQVVKGADPITFSPVLASSGSPTGYLKDEFHVYYIFYDGVAQVAYAATTSFVAIEGQENCGLNCHYDAWDSENKYYQGDIIKI